LPGSGCMLRSLLVAGLGEPAPLKEGRIFGDEGNDLINVDDGNGTVNCVPGRKDKVFFDENDTVPANCEIRNPASV
jgi:hypothetical protein